MKKTLSFFAITALVFLLLMNGALQREKSARAASTRAAQKPATILRARDFGAVGNGKTDDGAAVQKMLAAAAKTSGAARLQFEPKKTYFLKTGRERYAFLIDKARDLTIDGGGSIFLIDAQQRFLKLTNSQRIVVKNLKVDYAPLPFADGTVIAKDKAAGTLDVRIDDGMTLPPLGGATHQDGEQAYFGMLWHDGVYSEVGAPYVVGAHFWLGEVREAFPGSLRRRIVRVAGNDQNAAIFDSIEIGKWRISVPVRGVAHRFGPGATCEISGNRDVTFQDVEIWAAPWFAFNVIDNDGEVTFLRTNVRPKPGTTRLTSSWRDGFHVKNNRARLLWDGCILQGMNDDAFNIAMHTWAARRVLAPDHLEMQQNFPLGIATMRVGDTLSFYDWKRGVLRGRAKIKTIIVLDKGSADGAHPVAPLLDVQLENPIEDLAAGETWIWNEATSNPGATIRNCRIDKSCRFRSSVRIENTQFNALAWFTGDDVETPIPHDIVVKKCTFRLGSGNPSLALAMGGPTFEGHAPTAPVIHNVLLEGNRIYGDLRINDAAQVALVNNQFMDAKRIIGFKNVRDVTLRGNTRGNRALTLGDLEIGAADIAQIAVK